ncbi:hypothetical protein D3C73_1610300 [compost metagenome]
MYGFDLNWLLVEQDQDVELTGELINAFSLTSLEITFLSLLRQLKKEYQENVLDYLNYKIYMNNK